MQWKSVFLSHSSKDKPLARRIAADLQGAGIAVWLDEWEILIGDSLSQRIERGLTEADFVAVLLTQHSVKSGWVEKEWQAKIGHEATERKAVILPLKADNCAIPALLRDKKYADLQFDYVAAIAELIAAIRGHSARQDQASHAEPSVVAGNLVPPIPDFTLTDHLHKAIQDSNLPTVRALLGAGADPNARHPSGWTPLLKACESGDVAMASDLLRAGAMVNAHDVKPRSGGFPAWHAGYTPLHYAVEAGSKGLVLLLLKNGAHIDAMDEEHSSALHCAVRRHDVQMVELLLENGADVGIADRFGHSPVHASVSSFFDTDLLSFFLKRGFDPDLRSGRESVTLLHVAHSAEEAARLLIEHGADVNARDRNDQTPLFQVAFHGRPEVARLLLSHGADPNGRCKVGLPYPARELFGGTPLHVAAASGRLDMVRILLESGGDAGALTDERWSLLHCAASRQHSKVLRLVLARKLEINARDQNGQTPLHTALRTDYGTYGGSIDSKNFLDVVHLLTDRGADSAVADDDGQTPLHLLAGAREGLLARGLAEFARIEAIKLIIKRGSEVNARNGDGLTPVGIARDREHADAVAVLEAHGGLP